MKQAAPISHLPQILVDWDGAIVLSSKTKNGTKDSLQGMCMDPINTRGYNDSIDRRYGRATHVLHVAGTQQDFLTM